MKDSLENKILQYLKEKEGIWHKKVELYSLSDSWGYSPETCGRILRELAEKKIIEVDYYDGKYAKHLCKYAYNPPPKLKQVVEFIGNVAKLKYV